MSKNYFSGNKSHYIFCDICGQACYEYEAVRLSQYSGREGLLVCPNDADVIDAGLIPYTLPAEKNVKWVRINEKELINGAAPLDYETTTQLGI